MSYNFLDSQINLQINQQVAKISRSFAIVVNNFMGFVRCRDIFELTTLRLHSLAECQETGQFSDFLSIYM